MSALRCVTPVSGGLGSGTSGTNPNGGGGDGAGTNTGNPPAVANPPGIGINTGSGNPPKLDRCQLWNFSPLPPPLLPGNLQYGYIHIADRHFHGAGKGASEFGSALSNWAGLIGLIQTAHQSRRWHESGSLCALSLDLSPIIVGTDKYAGRTGVVTVVAAPFGAPEGVITAHPGYPRSGRY